MKDPHFGFESHVPNIPLAVLCIIAIAVYLAVSIGIVYGLIELFRWMLS